MEGSTAFSTSEHKSCANIVVWGGYNREGQRVYIQQERFFQCFTGWTYDIVDGWQFVYLNII